MDQIKQSLYSLYNPDQYPALEAAAIERRVSLSGKDKAAFETYTIALHISGKCEIFTGDLFDCLERSKSRLDSSLIAIPPIPL